MFGGKTGWILLASWQEAPKRKTKKKTKKTSHFEINQGVKLKIQLRETNSWFPTGSLSLSSVGKTTPSVSGSFPLIGGSRWRRRWWRSRSRFHGSHWTLLLLAKTLFLVHENLPVPALHAAETPITPAFSKQNEKKKQNQDLHFFLQNRHAMMQNQRQHLGF